LLDKTRDIAGSLVRSARTRIGTKTREIENYVDSRIERHLRFYYFNMVYTDMAEIMDGLGYTINPCLAVLITD